MSAVTGIYLYRLLLNIIFFVLRSFFTFTNSAYHDEMPHAGISAVYKCKKHVPKIYISQLKCSRISFLKLFLVPCMYAFTGCNLRVGKSDVFASNMIIFWRQYFTKLRLMGSGNAKAFATCASQYSWTTVIENPSNVKEVWSGHGIQA